LIFLTKLLTENWHSSYSCLGKSSR